MAFVNLFTPSTITSITTGASAFTALTFAAGGQVRLKNQSSADNIFFKFGISTDTVTNTTGICLGPGDVAGFTVPATTTGIITLAGANTPVLNVVQGWGS